MGALVVDTTHCFCKKQCEHLHLSCIAGCLILLCCMPMGMHGVCTTAVSMATAARLACISHQSESCKCYSTTQCDVTLSAVWTLAGLMQRLISCLMLLRSTTASGLNTHSQMPKSAWTWCALRACSHSMRMVTRSAAESARYHALPS